MNTEHVDQATGEIMDGQTFEVTAPTDEELVDELVLADKQAQNAVDYAGKIRLALIQRAEARGANTIFGKGMNFVVTAKNEYDRTKLPPLLEYLTPEEKKECFIPAHQETITVPDKYDMVKWNKAARAHGGELAAGLEAAKFPGKPTGKLVKTEEP